MEQTSTDYDKLAMLTSGFSRKSQTGSCKPVPAASARVMTDASTRRGTQDVPRWTWVFLAATILALSSTGQAYRLMSLDGRPQTSIPIGRLLLLNFTLWWVPAALTPAIFRFVAWLSRSGVSWIKSSFYHLGALALFSVVHFCTLFLAYIAVWWMNGVLTKMPLTSRAQQVYLDNLNWTIMTYGSIAALGYALNLRQRNDERALQVAKLETELVEARLGALAGELQPQFLY